MPILLVDGSNVIRLAYRLKGKPNFQLEAVLSDILVEYLRNLSEYYCCIECYFDGPKRPVKHLQGVNIFFSKKHKADKLILNSVYDYIYNYSREVQVVTADNEIIKNSGIYGAAIQYTYNFLKGFLSYVIL